MRLGVTGDLHQVGGSCHHHVGSVRGGRQQAHAERLSTLQRRDYVPTISVEDLGTYRESDHHLPYRRPHAVARDDRSALDSAPGRLFRHCGAPCRNLGGREQRRGHAGEQSHVDGSRQQFSHGGLTTLANLEGISVYIQVYMALAYCGRHLLGVGGDIAFRNLWSEVGVLEAGSDETGKSSMYCRAERTARHYGAQWHQMSNLA